MFDHGPGEKAGIVCYITMAGFLNGPGFQSMRDYLRRKCDRIWVIDCSPEGHQPSVSTRIFQGVQQPVCIVLASRSGARNEDTPADVRWRNLPKGHREEKFAALEKVSLHDAEWLDCPTDWRAPFLPTSKGAWSTFPAIEDLFAYNGSGVMPGRTWVIAPDQESLERRWQSLLHAPLSGQEELFHPHLRKGEPGDKHTNKVVRTPLAGYPPRPRTIADETDAPNTPERYAFRSFDRQWIIPDSRLINQPNPRLWEVKSNQQVFITAPSDRTPTSGPALTVTGIIPDLHHYAGRGGRAFPLWNDNLGESTNLRPGVLKFFTQQLGYDIAPEEVFAYIVAIGANPAYTSRFRGDLATPGLRIPITADFNLFHEAVDLGRTIIWLHTFGERMADAAAGRPAGPPRLPDERRPRIPSDGAIPENSDSMPDSIDYDSEQQRLLVGSGFIENVPPVVWNYEVSGKHVLRQWFSYRQKDRERPVIGDRRQPSTLSFVQPDHWLAEYTSELINVLNVLGWLVDLEPLQAELLDKVLSGPLVTDDELRAAGAFEIPTSTRSATRRSAGARLFD